MRFGLVINFVARYSC